MNSGDLLMVGVLLLGFSLAGAFVITMTLGAVRRMRELPRPHAAEDVEARLARIEVVLESIRTDMDRLMDHQRLAARKDAGLLEERSRER